MIIVHIVIKVHPVHLISKLMNILHVMFDRNGFSRWETPKRPWMKMKLNWISWLAILRYHMVSRTFMHNILNFTFSVMKATLQSQMSVHLFVRSSVCPSVIPSAKPLNSLKSSSFILHYSSFILHYPSPFFIHPSSIFIHPSFISWLLSFSVCFFVRCR